MLYTASCFPFVICFFLPPLFLPLSLSRFLSPTPIPRDQTKASLSRYSNLRSFAPAVLLSRPTIFSRSPKRYFKLSVLSINLSLSFSSSNSFFSFQSYLSVGQSLSLTIQTLFCVYFQSFVIFLIHEKNLICRSIRLLSFSHAVLRCVCDSNHKLSVGPAVSVILIILYPSPMYTHTHVCVRMCVCVCV
jgi:hypothetical protein